MITCSRLVTKTELHSWRRRVLRRWVFHCFNSTFLDEGLYFQVITRYNRGNEVLSPSADIAETNSQFFLINTVVRTLELLLVYHTCNANQ